MKNTDFFPCVNSIETSSHQAHELRTFQISNDFKLQGVYLFMQQELSLCETAVCDCHLDMLSI